MKTIEELEKGLAQVKAQAAEAWEQVKKHRAVYDEALSVWLPLQQRSEKMEETLGIRKEIEASK